MKKILITGVNSYIGTSFENYLKQWPDKFKVDKISMVNGNWRIKSFGDYDIIFHVAGIAHTKETKKNAALYYKVNRDLAIETAQKAKRDGVKQFIFLSSMSVYGLREGIITSRTIPTPKTNYGKSKLEAEGQIDLLADSNFKTVILRPPMVYGKGCKGNFQTLIRLTRKTLIFPKYNNQRSMIYIDNLSSFVKMVIDDSMSGVFFPQNREYVSTDNMVQSIGEALGKKIKLLKCFSPIVKAGLLFVPPVQKVFGSLIYKDVPNFEYKYCLYCFKDSIKKSMGEAL